MPPFIPWSKGGLPGLPDSSGSQKYGRQACTQAALVPFQLNLPSACMDALAKNLEGIAHANSSK